MYTLITSYLPISTLILILLNIMLILIKSNKDSYISQNYSYPIAFLPGLVTILLSIFNLNFESYLKLGITVFSFILSSLTIICLKFYGLEGRFSNYLLTLFIKYLPQYLYGVDLISLGSVYPEILNMVSNNSTLESSIESNSENASISRSNSNTSLDSGYLGDVSNSLSSRSLLDPIAEETHSSNANVLNTLSTTTQSIEIDSSSQSDSTRSTGITELSESSNSNQQSTTDTSTQSIAYQPHPPLGSRWSPNTSELDEPMSSEEQSETEPSSDEVEHSNNLISSSNHPSQNSEPSEHIDPDEEENSSPST
ncbi:MAG: hypothetical protein WDN66_03290 [Candidatus Saccharibacteria bacterium]